jgi:hypothetical protein
MCVCMCLLACMCVSGWVREWVSECVCECVDDKQSKLSDHFKYTATLDTKKSVECIKNIWIFEYDTRYS